MIKLLNGGVYLVNRSELVVDDEVAEKRISDLSGHFVSRQEALKGTITHSILKKHNTCDDMQHLEIKFNALASHDLTYVGIIQSAKASGLERFPMPYILTNCHNSLCAVGGTLNEDDHQFGLSAAKKYGGIYVPPHLAIIHSYVREMNAECGSMILGSDSHTRYGAHGTMGIGEGGGELVKQLLDKTYSIDYPEVICVYMTGKPQLGVGPHDIALAIIGAVFKNGFVKNKVMEFVGEGVGNLSVDYRNSIDIMTTETACLSSIWRTDDLVNEFFIRHGRPEAYRHLTPENVAWYDGLIEVDLSKIPPMISLPFHPSNVHTIESFRANTSDILHQVEMDAKELVNCSSSHLYELTDKVINGQFRVDQGVIAGCAGGTYENIIDAANIIGNNSPGNDVFSLSIYPASQPVAVDLARKGVLTSLMNAGVTIRTAICGPCFGAGDIPADRQLSVRHTTRNFPNREGSKPTAGQIASVALLDARSIAATAINRGTLTPATDIVDIAYDRPIFCFDKTVYDNRVYNGYKMPNSVVTLRYGPGITDWPEIGRLERDLLLGVASVITDPVTTTDELIPSGEAATYRSNPIQLAEFTLSRKDPKYVGNAKRLYDMEVKRRNGNPPSNELMNVFERFAGIKCLQNIRIESMGIGSLIYAVKPGDGSAREQAASCQRVLGGCANIAKEYATKRYRSNLINWGILPLMMDENPDFKVGEYVLLPGIRKLIENGAGHIEAYHIGDSVRKIELYVDALAPEERRILLEGCLINYYKR